MNWVVDCTTTVTVRSCRTSVKLLLEIATTTPRTTRCGGRSTPTPCCWLSTNSVSARIRRLPRRSPLIPTISPTWRESRPAEGKSPSSLLSPWFSNAISVSARTRTSQRRPFSSCTLITLRWKSTAVIIPWMLIRLDVDPSSAHLDLDSLSAHAAVGTSSNAATNAAMSFIGGLLLTRGPPVMTYGEARKFSTPWGRRLARVQVRAHLWDVTETTRCDPRGTQGRVPTVVSKESNRGDALQGASPLFELARPEGVEPPLTGFEAQRFIH